MKYLKLFEELKSQTYNKAASKLKQMGHERRSKSLYDWSAIVQKRETFEKWAKLGTFEMSFYKTKWDQSTKTTNHEFLFDGNFHVGLEVDSDFFCERISEIQDNQNDNLFLIFNFGVIPADKETEDKMLSYPEIKNNMWNNGYWNSNFSIKLSQKGFEISPKAEAYFEEFEGFKYHPSNRRSASKFHRLIVDIFEEKIILPCNLGTIAKAKAMLEEKTGDKEMWSRIVNSVKNMSLNYLYRN
jgi:hypothetical protein